jgi:hypothetical protein
MICLLYDVLKKPRPRPEETAESAEIAEKPQRITTIFLCAFLCALGELRGSIWSSLRQCIAERLEEDLRPSRRPYVSPSPRIEATTSAGRQDAEALHPSGAERARVGVAGMRTA